jgi:hypothetical protein
MAEIFRINIEFNFGQQKLLKIPEEISVPQNTIVQWNITNLDEFFFESNLWRRGTIFTLYFDDTSPFFWKRQFVQTNNDPRFYRYPQTLRLAEEVADKKGNYKYGVRVSQADSDETLYDEDPILIVY